MVFRKPNHNINNVERQLARFIEDVNKYKTALEIYENNPTQKNEICLQRAYTLAEDSRENIGGTPVSILEKMSRENQRVFGEYYKKVDQLTDHWFALEVETGRAKLSLNQLGGE